MKDKTIIDSRDPTTLKDAYAPPSIHCRPSPISDADVERLLASDDVERIAISDVSDVLLYGAKYKRVLTGSHAKEAAERGLDPVVYQSVLWWCLAYIPVRPLQTYLVMSEVEPEDADEHYVAIPTRPDTDQVTTHYVISIVIVATTLAIVGGFAWLRIATGS